MWKNDDNELFFDVGEVVRFRVESEQWHDQSPDAPPKATDTAAEIERKVPYSIIASMCDAGLGPVTWW